MNTAQLARQFDFTCWRPEQWLVVREPRFPLSRHFVPDDNCIVNYIDPEASEKDVSTIRDGVSVASMVLPDLTLADCDVCCEMAFEGMGAPAILTHVAHDQGLATAMYSLVLYRGGLNLWRIVNGDHLLVGQTEEAVTEGQYHEVRLHVEGERFEVWLDNRKQFSGVDESKLAPGALGLWAGEGVCRFRQFRLIY